MIGNSINRMRSMSGLIEVRGVLGSAVNNLGVRIVGGEWAEGEVIPKESQMIEDLKVGRSVVRESIRILSAKGLVISRTSSGTRVLPRSEWRLLDPDVINWLIQAGDHKMLWDDLLRLRMVLEPSVVRTATLYASESMRMRIKNAWQEKLLVEEEDSLPLDEKLAKFIDADLNFHRMFFVAAGSEMLEQLFNVIHSALAVLIEIQTDGLKAVGVEDSHDLHAAVYEAFERRDAAGAEEAMRRLIEKASEDAHTRLKD